MYLHCNLYCSKLFMPKPANILFPKCNFLDYGAGKVPNRVYEKLSSVEVVTSCPAEADYLIRL